MKYRMPSMDWRPNPHNRIVRNFFADHVCCVEVGWQTCTILTPMCERLQYKCAVSELWLSRTTDCEVNHFVYRIQCNKSVTNDTQVTFGCAHPPVSYLLPAARTLQCRTNVISALTLRFYNIRWMMDWKVLKMKRAYFFLRRYYCSVI